MEKPVWKPTDRQERLLKIAFSPEPLALQAWQDWKAGADIKKIDAASLRLLPLAYGKIKRFGVEDGLAARLKSVYKKTWYINQILFDAMASVIRDFRDRGVRTMLLKGTALTFFYYKDFGLRPMDDFDILVPRDQARAAIDSLRESGWTPQPRIKPSRNAERIFERHNAWHFKNETGCLCDLHWSLWEIWENLHKPEVQNEFWSRAIVVRLRNRIEAYGLNPADLLLHVCKHGASCESFAPVRWVADALTVLASPSELDWDRFEYFSRKYSLVYPFRNMLFYLKRTFGAPIPEKILNDFEETQIPRSEIKLYRNMVFNKAGIERVYQSFRIFWLRYKLFIRRPPPKDHKPVTLFQWLQLYWDLDSPWHVCWAFPLKLAKSIMKSFGNTT